jgi:hypothetical protein
MIYPAAAIINVHNTNKKNCTEFRIGEKAFILKDGMIIKYLNAY